LCGLGGVGGAVTWDAWGSVGGGHGVGSEGSRNKAGRTAGEIITGGRPED